jgi:hypothetical protein
MRSPRLFGKLFGSGIIVPLPLERDRFEGDLN